MKAGVLLAAIGVFAASLAANGACVFPFFEPEQPDALKKWANLLFTPKANIKLIDSFEDSYIKGY